jgi:co-chaperonin GroES (HSP10)
VTDKIPEYYPEAGRLLVRVDRPEQVGSIVLPKTMIERDVEAATVLRIGPDREMRADVKTPMELRVGDRVILGPAAIVSWLPDTKRTYGFVPRADVEGIDRS